MRDYGAAYASFDLAVAFARLAGDPSVGLNACVECCDRYADTGRVALHYESQTGASAAFTFADLRDAAARFANLLVRLGVKPGDRVAGLLPRTPQHLVMILGTWLAGAVYQPLFAAFGPKAIEHRIATARTSLVVTDIANRGKLDDIAACPPVILVAPPGSAFGRDIDFAQAVGGESPIFAPVLRNPEHPFLMMFTSGTTGLPKPVAVPLKAIAAFAAYMIQSIDLRPEDGFWNIADPGWAYGLYYAVTGPLAIGHATTFYDGPFTAESTYRIVAKRRITNIAGSPTAFRLIIAAGEAAAAEVKGLLRVASSAGEPLNPEVIRWFDATLGIPIHDHYGQTEVGMIVCNHHRLLHPVRPGVAGFPSPGYRVAVVDDDLRELPPGKPGILAVDRPRSPMDWFRGYWEQPTTAFRDAYYLTGDTVELNDDGSVSYVGRSDDIITSSGYRIGPFDVESALIEHPAVVEAAVVGKPDPERTEVVKAFVVLARGYLPDAALVVELQLHVRSRLSAHAYPREIAFVDSLPKTPSGKLQRFILRNQEIAAAKAAEG
jgi:acetyl-CoA synthetase